MAKVKTFSTPLRIFHTAEELARLDRQVNNFLSRGKGRRLISISDVATADDSGATMGLIRVIAYEGQA